MQYKIPLVLTPQAEGVYTVTSPLLPELVTEGDTVDEALANVREALAAVIESYEDMGRSLPEGVVGLIGNSSIPNRNALLWFPIGAAAGLGFMLAHVW